MKIVEQLSMWNVYFNHLFMHPLLIGILIFSFIASISFFILFIKTNKIRIKTTYLYSHIFFFYSPFIFAAFLWNCVMPVFMCTPKLIIYSLSGGYTLSIFTGFLVIPYIYPWATKSNEIKNSEQNRFLKKWTNHFSITQPSVYSLNEATPLAYSITNIKPAIFFSVGLLEILNKKEMQAVLLHELYHIKNKSSIWKFSLNQIKRFAPLSYFSSIRKSINNEERDADLFAIKVQGTKRFLQSAKKKINQFDKHAKF